MEHLRPLADDPLPPPSPSHTDSSASSRSCDRRPADLHSLSSRESDWSSSDAEHDTAEDDDEAFDLVSSAELPPPVIAAPIPAATAAISNAGEPMSADELDPPPRMRLSFPDPLDTSCSSVASDNIMRRVASAHSDDDRPAQPPWGSTLLDGEGAYSLLLDAPSPAPRPTTSESSDRIASLDSDAGSSRTSPLLVARKDSQVVAAEDGDHEGVEAWVRRTQRSAPEYESATCERAVQTVRSGHDFDEATASTIVGRELSASTSSALAGSSLVSSQATVVPIPRTIPIKPAGIVAETGALDVAEQSTAPLSPKAVLPQRGSGDRAHTLTPTPASRRRTLVAVALASALILSATPWFAYTPSSGRGTTDVSILRQEMASSIAGAVVQLSAGTRQVGGHRLSDTPCLDAILPLASGIAPSTTASPPKGTDPARRAASTEGARQAQPPMMTAVDASPSAGSSTSETAERTVQPVIPTAAPCGACALSTLPASPPRALSLFAPPARAPRLRPEPHASRPGLRHQQRSAHARARRTRVLLERGSAKPAVEFERAEDEVSLFRRSQPGGTARVPELPATAGLGLGPAWLPTLRRRVRNAISNHLTRAQGLTLISSCAFDAQGHAKRIARAMRKSPWPTQDELRAALTRTAAIVDAAKVREIVLALSSMPRRVDVARHGKHLRARLADSAHNGPKVARDTLLIALDRSRRAARKAEAGRRALLGAVRRAELPLSRSACRTLERMGNSRPSWRRLREAFAPHLDAAELNAHIRAVSRLHSRATKRLSRAWSEARQVRFGTVAKHIENVADRGAQEGRRHIKRAARTVQRLKKGAKERVGRRPRHY